MHLHFRGFLLKIVKVLLERKINVMETFVTIIIAILGTIVGFFVYQIYHKMFDVVYFSGQAICGEIFGCWMAGCIIVGLAFAYWWVLLIIGIIVFAIFKAKGK